MGSVPAMDEYERQQIDISLSLSVLLSLYSLNISLSHLKKKKVSPGDTWGQESHMKSGLLLEGPSTWSVLCPEARPRPASCKDHSAS